METLMLKAVALLLLAAFLLLLNYFVTRQPWRFVSFYGMVICVLGAAWFVGRVVFS